MVLGKPIMDNIFFEIFVNCHNVRSEFPNVFIIKTIYE